MKLPETIPGWTKPLVGTKFIATMFSFTGSMVAVANGWINGGEWVAAMTLTVGAFIAGNAYVTAHAIKHDKPKPSETHE